MSNIKLTKTVADAASARQKDNNNLGDGLTPPEADIPRPNQVHRPASPSPARTLLASSLLLRLAVTWRVLLVGLWSATRSTVSKPED